MPTPQEVLSMLSKGKKRKKGKKGRKIGRQIKREYQKRYTIEERWLKNRLKKLKAYVRKHPNDHQAESRLREIST
jgi:hypothetical protein